MLQGRIVIISSSLISMPYDVEFHSGFSLIPRAENSTPFCGSKSGCPIFIIGQQVSRLYNAPHNLFGVNWRGCYESKNRDNSQLWFMRLLCVLFNFHFNRYNFLTFANFFYRSHHLFRRIKGSDSLSV